METQTFGEPHTTAAFRETPVVPPLTADFALREDDLCEVARTLLRGWRGRALVAITLGLVLAAIGNIFGSVFLLSLVVLTRRAMFRTMRQRYRREPMLREPMSWTFSAEGIAVDHPRSSSRNTWSVYTRIIETPHLFLLCTQGQLYNPIPKRAFADAADRERFRQLVRDQGLPLVPVGRIPPELTTG